MTMAVGLTGIWAGTYHSKRKEKPWFCGAPEVAYDLKRTRPALVPSRDAMEWLIREIAFDFSKGKICACRPRHK